MKVTLGALSSLLALIPLRILKQERQRPDTSLPAKHLRTCRPRPQHTCCCPCEPGCAGEGRHNFTLMAPGTNQSTRLPQRANRRASWIPQLGVPIYPTNSIPPSAGVSSNPRAEARQPQEAEKFARKREGQQGNAHPPCRRRVTSPCGATSRLNLCGAGTPLPEQPPPSLP